MDTALTSAYKGVVSLVDHKGKEPARCLDLGTGVSTFIQLSPSGMHALPGLRSSFVPLLDLPVAVTAEPTSRFYVLLLRVDDRAAEASVSRVVNHLRLRSARPSDGVS